MNNEWNYDSFDDVFAWCQKSNIGSTQGLNSGKYKLYIASAKEIKYYNDYMENGETLIFGTGGNPCIHYETGKFAYTNHCEAAKPKIDVCTKFYYYFFQKDKYHDLQSTFVGGGIKNSSKKRIGKLSVPVPSINEQQRIVDKIEELFSKLDNGVEELNKIKEQIKIYRQAVLEEAFHNVPASQTIKDISDIVTSGSRGWAKYYSDKGVRFIRITDLTRDSIELKNNSIQFVNLPENAEGKRSRLHANDVLVSITADLGSIALVPSDIGEAYINQHIAMIRFSNSIQGKFMAWYLKSEYGQKELLKNKRGAGKLGLGLDDIRNSIVPNVDNETANLIVNKIEQNLSIYDNLEKTVNESMQKAESLRQSILKQAFEGKLV